MDLTLAAEEQHIIDSARQFLSGAFPLSRLHDDDLAGGAPARRQIAEMGWFAIALPEALGGIGLTEVEEALLFREVGRALGPTLILPSALAAQTAAASGHAELAALLIEGERGAALAQRAPDRSILLYDGQDADLAVLVEPDGAVLFDVSEVVLEPVPCLDKSVPMARADLSSAPVLARAPGPEVYRRGALAVAAMQAGSSEAALAMIVDYARIRTTFGKPIGAYQAVRHPCADMAVRCEAARAQLLYAAVSLRDRRPDADLMLESARVVAHEAATRNVDDNIQLHGGIGITEEHDAHLFMKRVQVLGRWFGSDRVMLDRMSALARSAA